MRRFSPLLLVLAILLAFTACQQRSPEEQVAAKRAEYTVELNSWYAQVENVSLEATEEPIDEAGADGETAADGDGMADDEMAEGEAGDEMADEMVMTGPQPHTIVFDLLVLFDGRGEPLHGVTVKVTQADGTGTEKESWLQYLEMPPMTKGVPEQVGFQLEGVPFQEGEVFAVTLSKNVPAEERSQYREFQSAGS